MDFQVIEETCSPSDGKQSGWGDFPHFLQRELSRALAAGALEMHYQPQVDMASGRLIGVEALARWFHPTLGAVSPGEFIEAAEEYGLIGELTRWALRTACRQNAVWQAAGHTPFRVSVNVSPIDFRQPQFVDEVAAILEGTCLAPCWLELELTECAIFSNIASAAESMRQLVDMGVSLAIDDFGTGYSSMAYLKHFPITRLKLDRSFVRDLFKRRRDRAIVESILAFSSCMGLEMVAEGIETDRQFEFFKNAGCHVGQGYLLGRPGPASELESTFQLSGFHLPRRTQIGPVTPAAP